jgi:hypothetical protein
MYHHAVSVLFGLSRYGLLTAKKYFPGNRRGKEAEYAILEVIILHHDNGTAVSVAPDEVKHIDFITGTECRPQF